MALPRIYCDVLVKNPDMVKGSGTAQRSHFWVSGTISDGELYTLTINSDAVTYTASSDTTDTFTDGLVAAVQASGTAGYAAVSAYDAQVDTITIGGTIASSEVFTVTIGVQSVSFTTTDTSTTTTATGIKDAINNSTLANFKDLTASSSGAVVTVWNDAPDPEGTWTAAGTTDSASGTITITSLQACAIIADLAGVAFTQSFAYTSGGTPTGTANTDSVTANVARTCDNWTVSALTQVQDQSEFPYTGQSHLRGYSMKTTGAASGYVYQDIPRGSFRRGLRNGKTIQACVHYYTTDTYTTTNATLTIRAMTGATSSQSATTNLTHNGSDGWKIGTAEITIDTATYPDLDAIRVELGNVKTSGNTMWFDSVSCGYVWEPTRANGGDLNRWRLNWRQHGFKNIVTAGGWSSIYAEHEYRELRALWESIEEAEFFVLQDLWEDCRHGRAWTIWQDRDNSSIETDLQERDAKFILLGRITKGQTNYDLPPGHCSTKFDLRGRSIVPIE